jgi:hypothetical protein
MGLLSPTLSSRGGEGENPARGFSAFKGRPLFGASSPHTIFLLTASSPRPSPPGEEREIARRGYTKRHAIEQKQTKGNEGIFCYATSGCARL